MAVWLLVWCEFMIPWLDLVTTTWSHGLHLLTISIRVPFVRSAKNRDRGTNLHAKVITAILQRLPCVHWPLWGSLVHYTLLPTHRLPKAKPASGLPSWLSKRVAHFWIESRFVSVASSIVPLSYALEIVLQSFVWSAHCFSLGKTCY